MSSRATTLMQEELELAFIRSDVSNMLGRNLTKEKAERVKRSVARFSEARKVSLGALTDTTVGIVRLTSAMLDQTAGVDIAEAEDGVVKEGEIERDDTDLYGLRLFARDMKLSVLGD